MDNILAFADEKAAAERVGPDTDIRYSGNVELLEETANPEATNEPEVMYEPKTIDEPSVKNKYFYIISKRIFDIIFSALFILLLFPFFVVIAVAIKIDSTGSAIYSQTRIGKNGKPFKFYKFRSMCDNAEYLQTELAKRNIMDGPVFKVINDPRVTRVGRFIRRTSIDELPQLINILRGEMSFIGPRPPLPNEVAQYNSHQMRRLEVTGGLSCYWQISGRNTNTTFDEWVELDLKYIRERSVWTDFKILILTFKVLFTGKGAF